MDVVRGVAVNRRLVASTSALAVFTKLSRTSNFIGSCWHEAPLF